MEETLWKSNSKIYQSNKIINGNNNEITGNSNIIRGNNNKITGDNNNVNGSNNEIFGDNNTFGGGNNNTFNGIGNIDNGSGSNNSFIEKNIKNHYNPNLDLSSANFVKTNNYQNKVDNKNLPPKIILPAEDVNEKEINIDDYDPEQHCNICMERKIVTVIVDCGHRCLCVTCCQTFKNQQTPTCPKCRQNITHIIKTY